MRLLLHSSSLRLGEAQRAQLHEAAPGLEIIERPAGTLEECDGRGVEILVSDPVPRERTRWPDLRWIQLLSAGANQLRDRPWLAAPVAVTTASGNHGVPIAQHVTCTYLMLVHRMTAAAAYGASRRWPDRLALGGEPVRGRTAGIFGYGSIGRECARQLHHLGLRIVCLKRDPARRTDDGHNAWPGTGDPSGSLPERWYGPAQLDDFLADSDLLVVAAPATAATAGLIGAAQLARLRRGAVVVVVSRGGLVDESALAAALHSGHIGGAAVDCFAQEPAPEDHPLFGAPGVLLTPHVSGIYPGFGDEMVRLLAANLRRHHLGQPLLNRVDPRHGY